MLWALHRVGSTYGSRPSRILGLDDDSWLAFQVDLACLNFGTWVQNKLDERTGKGKKQKQRYSLEYLLQPRPKPTDGQPAAEGSNDPRYRNPTGRAVRKVRPNPDGTW